MKRIQCFLALLLLLSPLVGAVAQDSAAAVKQEIENLKQQKVESANSFEASRKELDANIAYFMNQRAGWEPKLQDHTKVANGITESEMASAAITEVDKTLTKLRSERAKLLADSQARQSQLDSQIRLWQSRLFEIQHPMTNSLGSDINLHSPASASSSSAATSSSQANGAANTSRSGLIFASDPTRILSSSTPASKPVLLAQATPSPAPVAALTQPTATKLSGEDKLTLATLNDIIADIDKSTDADSRTKLMNEFLTQSEPFVASHPDYTNLWVTRATAALETGNVEAGWNAGQELKRLNVLDGDDAKALQAMAGLKRKGWLDENEARKAIQASTRKNWWFGSWQGSTTTIENTKKTERQFMVKISNNPDGSPTLLITILEKAFNSDGTLNFDSTVEIPGDCHSTIHVVPIIDTSSTISISSIQFGADESEITAKCKRSFVGLDVIHPISIILKKGENEISFSMSESGREIAASLTPANN